MEMLEKRCSSLSPFVEENIIQLEMFVRFSPMPLCALCTSAGLCVLIGVCVQCEKRKTPLLLFSIILPTFYFLFFFWLMLWNFLHFNKGYNFSTVGWLAGLAGDSTFVYIYMASVCVLTF